MAPITPFSHGQAAVIGFIVCLMGFFGGLVMSAIKRDYGVKDWGKYDTRATAVCLTAWIRFVLPHPLFFHITRYFWNG